MLSEGAPRSEDRPLKIAYLSDLDPRLAWTYSGGNRRLLSQVEKMGDVTVLSSHWHGAEMVRRGVERLSEGLLLRLRFRLHILLSRIIAAGVRRELAAGQYDVLFASYSFHSLLNLRPPYPITTVFTSDATQTVYKTSEIGAQFGSYFAPGRLLDRWVERAERKVFRGTDLMLWPSHWLKDAADARYGLGDEASRMVPWGANIEAPDPADLLLDNPMEDELRLLLVGRDWFAKGGPKVVEIFDALKARGVNVRFTVVGSSPPDFHMREGMEVHPSLDKAKPEEWAVFLDIYRRAHFLVMPSYESYGFAFCEASAYGLPSLCLRVGGVPVFEGENGYALPAEASAEDFANRILELKADPARYRALRESTRRCYLERLNWDAWRTSAEAMIREKVAARG